MREALALTIIRVLVLGSCLIYKDQRREDR